QTTSFSSCSLLHLKIRIRMSYGTARGGARAAVYAHCDWTAHQSVRRRELVL
ncbi:uncharacterized, partial [Tachysurus ichikawai]